MTAAKTKPVLLSRYQNSAGERVRIALALKQIEYEYLPVSDFGKDRYRRVNPQNLMPALLVGDKVIGQSTAILEYLEEQWPARPLLPKDPSLRAHARAFAQHIAAEMHALTVRRVRNFLRQVNTGGTTAEVEKQWLNHWYRQGFGALESILRQRLENFMYCFGQEPGWADLYLVPQARNAERFGFPLQDYPLLAGIFAVCRQHPAFVAAAPENQPDSP